MIKETKISRIMAYVVMTVGVFFVVIPLLWSVSLAFRSNYEIANLKGLGWHTFIPQNFTTDSFVRMFQKLDFMVVFRNTLVVSISVTALSMLFNTMAGYAFARMNFVGKKYMFMIVVATLIMPIEILIVPLYMQITKMNLVNTFASLIIPFMANGFGIFFMRQFFTTVPTELDESANLDGCGRYRTFWHILLPLAKTPLITLGLIAFLGQWDSFIIPVTFVSGREKMLLQVALSYLSFDELINDVSLIFAGLLISSIPIIVLFVSLQKYYVAGIATSGLKG